MEVLFVSHKYPPALGGMERQSYALIQGMHRYTRVHVLVYDGSENLVNFFLQLKKRIYATLASHAGISVLHFNDGLMGAWCQRFRKYPHVKRVVTFHGLDLVFPNFVYQRLLVPRFQHFDLIICVSQATAEAAIQRGLPPEKVRVILNGVDTARPTLRSKEASRQFFCEVCGLSLDEKKKYVVGLGRAVKRKGFSWFLRQVMPMLDENTVFLLAGPFQRKDPFKAKLLYALPSFLRHPIELFWGWPSDTLALRRILQEDTFQGRFHHLGPLSSEGIACLFSIADVFVMPNIAVPGDMEGFGLVGLEASLHGVPVFASALEGIPDAVHHGGNGHLLPSGEARNWAEALQEYFEKGSVQEVPLENPSAHTVAHFGWDKMVEAYYQAFAQLCGQEERY